MRLVFDLRTMKIFRYQAVGGETGFAHQSNDGAFECLEGSLLEGFRSTGVPANVEKLLAPIVPAAILCVGLNYRRHADETGAKYPAQPVLFMKMPSAVQNPEDPIEIPGYLPSNEVDFECELAVVIGKRAKNVPRDRALDFVLGYTCANDVSARDWQIKRGGSQWCRGKTFDTFAPLGPCIVTGDEITNPNTLRIRTILNGEVVQDSNTADMIFDVPTLIEFLSGSTTLEPGTVILTGTPEGVGMARKPPRWLRPGDSVTVEIDRIGALRNPVIAERGQL